jgi:hypothetical protein
VNLKKLFAILAMLFCLTTASYGTTYSFTPSTPLSTITTDLAVTGPNTYNFAAGTYTQITSTLTFPCSTGNVYQGPVVPFVVGTGVTPTAILDASFTGSNLMKLTGNNAKTTPGSGCTVQYLRFENQNVYVSPPVSGLLFQYNMVDHIVGSVAGTGNTTSWAGVYVDNGTVQDIGYSTFQWNTFGPSCSDIDSNISTDYGGTCGGIIIHGSNVNLSVLNNNVSGQIEEFFHTLAQGATGGQISTNLLIENNDMGFIHRIAIETQQEQVTNQVIKYNDTHDQYTPAQFSFGISNACCASSGGSTAPGTVTSYNVLVNNEPLGSNPSYNWGYGIEAWGNQSQFNYNVVQGNYMANAIALGGASSAHSTSPVAINNVLNGAMSHAVTCEEGGTLPSCTYVDGTPVYSPNTTSATVSTVASTTPSASPASGSYSGSQTVTLSDSGVNTSIYYTTDGTSPVPGSGTTALYSTPFTVPVPSTVKTVAMWGTGANPYSYPSGWGYVPSSVVTNTYTAATGVPTITINGNTITITGIEVIVK